MPHIGQSTLHRRQVLWLFPKEAAIYAALLVHLVKECLEPFIASFPYM